MTDIELELRIAKSALEEAEESFTQLREDYHALREHTDLLESLLKEHQIEFPHFWGW